MDHKQKAKAYFMEGYNCAQAVFLAWHEELGLEPKEAARMASSFGGGMGRLREVCGALSGAFLVAGMLWGYDDPGDQEGKKQQYERVQELAKAFQNKHGTILCRELLGIKQGPDSPTPLARTKQYYASRPCAQFVSDAAELLEALQNDELPKHP